MDQWDILPWDIVIVNAKYRENVLPEHKGNLFIEACPDYWGEEAIKQMFTGIPEKKDENIEYDFHELYAMTSRLDNFLIPFRYHFEIAMILYNMVIEGYKKRFCKGIYTQLQNIRELNEVAEQIDDNINSYDLYCKLKNTNINSYNLCNRLKKDNGTVPKSLFIVGESGSGKTLTIDMICQMFPDGIKHTEYKGRAITRLQIPCIKIDCPRNGNLMEICQRFYRRIDIIAGTNYLDRLNLRVRTIARAIIEMDRLANQYAVGILIIDEIQNVLQTESGNQFDQVLNFLVELSNTFGIPTVFIGTPEALALLKERSAVIRRLTTEGERRFERLKRDDSRWNKFIETLWQYQYLPQYVPLNQSLKNCFYKYTQGNIGQLINLYRTVQKEALFEVNPTITCAFVDKVAKECFYSLKEMNEDLASGEVKRINKYRDIGWDYEVKKNENSKEQVDKTRALYNNKRSEEDEKRLDTKEQLILDMIKVGTFETLERIDLAIIAEDVVQHNKVDESYMVLKKLCLEACLKKVNNIQMKLDKQVDKKGKEVVNEDERYSLINLYNKAQKEQRYPKEVLEEYGYIINPIKEFLD